MGRIAEETIKRILELTDIVKLVGEYVPLKRAGTLYKGCCPFHHEKTPSFTVSSSRQNYKCFGCGEGGNAFGFLMRQENLSFVDAVRKLADKAGIPIIEDDYNPQADQERRYKRSLIDVQKLAAQWFYLQLRENPLADAARAYLAQRGFSLELAQEWNIGWVPEQAHYFLDWARSVGISGRQLVDSGLCFLRQENNARSGILPRFHDRLMFPIANDYGEYVAFSGRLLVAKENTGKYINSPETAIFRKGRVIFGLDKARSTIGKIKDALLCEGQLDVIACHSAGITQAIAPLGTAFTKDHARLLRRYTTQVTLCFDGDSAGIKAADRAYHALVGEDIFVNIALLPPGDDPDSFIKREGVERFREFLGQSMPFISALITRAQGEGVLHNPEKKILFVESLATHIAAIPNALYQDSVITDVSIILRLNVSDFREEIRRASKEIVQRRQWEEDRALKEEEENSEISDEYQGAGTISSERVENADNVTSQELNEYNSLDNTLPRELHARTIALDRPIAQLCELSLRYNRVQELLIEHIEDLITPLSTLRGGKLLQNILSVRPDVDSPASVETFFESLMPKEAYTLRQLFSEAPMPSLEELTPLIPYLVAEVVRLSLQKEKEAIVASLSCQDLTDEEKTICFKKLTEINKLLR